MSAAPESEPDILFEIRVQMENMDSEYHQLLLWKYQELKSKGLQAGNKPSGVIYCKNNYGPLKIH